MQQISEKRHGLGRGLGSLLGEQPKSHENGMRQIPTDRIDPNPQQPRKTFDGAALVDLENSIRELGVLVPILVRTKGDRFELIAGERRLRASRAAELPYIPAIVRDADDQSSLEFAIVENLQREDLDPIEEAMGFSDLTRDYGFTQEKLASRLGKSRSAIANTMRLLELADDIKSMVHRRALSAGHARALLSLPMEERSAVAERVVRDGLTVRDIEKIARQRSMPVVKGEIAPVRRDAEREAVEDRLRMRFGAAARIVGDAKGRIELAFTDKDDLFRVVDLLLAE